MADDGQFVPVELLRSDVAAPPGGEPSQAEEVAEELYEELDLSHLTEPGWLEVIGHLERVTVRIREVAADAVVLTEDAARAGNSPSPCAPTTGFSCKVVVREREPRSSRGGARMSVGLPAGGSYQPQTRGRSISPCAVLGRNIGGEKGRRPGGRRIAPRRQT